MNYKAQRQGSCLHEHFIVTLINLGGHEPWRTLAGKNKVN